MRKNNARVPQFSSVPMKVNLYFPQEILGPPQSELCGRSWDTATPAAAERNLWEGHRGHLVAAEAGLLALLEFHPRDLCLWGVSRWTRSPTFCPQGARWQGTVVTWRAVSSAAEAARPWPAGVPGDTLASQSPHLWAQPCFQLDTYYFSSTLGSHHQNKIFLRRRLLFSSFPTRHFLSCLGGQNSILLHDLHGRWSIINLLLMFSLLLKILLCF